MRLGEFIVIVSCPRTRVALPNGVVAEPDWVGITITRLLPVSATNNSLVDGRNTAVTGDQNTAELAGGVSTVGVVLPLAPKFWNDPFCPSTAVACGENDVVVLGQEE